jgi:hypothetical protein
VLERLARPHIHWSLAAALLIGIAQVIWIIVQLLIIPERFFLQPALFLVGLAIVLTTLFVAAHERPAQSIERTDQSVRAGHKVLRILGGLALGTVGVIAFGLVLSLMVYPADYVFRVLAWQESDAFDWQKFPLHPLEASPRPYQFASAPDPRVEATFEDLSNAKDWDQFLADNQTQAFIVIQDGKVLYENYFNGTKRDSLVTSFSVAKSFVSTLIGLAIQDGFIHSVDDPITDYLPELAQRDPRFRDITVRDLLRMASGLDYQAFRPLILNGDDPLTTQPDLDCGDIPFRNFKVLPPDPHRFDGRDNDGIGCETR